MGLLKSLAQNVMDLYFQSYRQDTDFFELYHFQYLCSITYAQMLQDEYEKSYAKNLNENGIGQAQLNPAWFIHEKIAVERSDEIAEFKSKLKCPVFSFRYDRQTSGIKDIIPSNKKCGDFIRMNSDQRWELRIIPQQGPETFWFLLGQEIFYSKFNCGVKENTIIYIPSVSGLNDDAVVAEGMERAILEATLNLMFVARQGKPVIDTTNDGNPNVALETEINDRFSKVNPKG